MRSYLRLSWTSTCAHELPARFRNDTNLLYDVTPSSRTSTATTTKTMRIPITGHPPLAARFALRSRSPGSSSASTTAATTAAREPTTTAAGRGRGHTGTVRAPEAAGEVCDVQRRH